MGNSKVKQNVFKKIGEDFKLQLLTCVVLCAIVILAFLFVNSIVERKNFKEYTIVNDIKFINAIENISMESDETKVEGYAFMLEKNSSNNLISVFLRNIISEEEVWLDMQQVERPDVNSYFEDIYDYNNSGFIATIDREEIGIEETYEIIINIDYVETNDKGSKDVRKTVSTNRYLSDGKLYTYNSNEFNKPNLNIESELLLEVINEGRQCFYREDINMYVYQYNNQLYWIADENFNFEDDGSTHIVYQVYTTQTDKLPEEYKQNRFNPLGFNFERREYTEENTSPYRVAIMDIPNDYSITQIRTGVYDTINKKTLWFERFHIDQNIK